MKNLVEFYKKHLEIINLIIISCFLFLSCFFEAFVYITVVFCVLLAIFLKFENILCVFLFTWPFEQLFKLKSGFLLYSLMWVILASVACIKYIIELILKRKKINLKTGIPIAIFLLFIILPIHKAGIRSFAMYFSLFAFMYLTYEYRKEISFKKISFALFFGVISSSLFYLTKFISSRVDAIVPVVYPLDNCAFIRFSAFASHPNGEGIICLVALCFLFALAYKKEIKLWQFVILFAMIFVPAYFTISRNFLVAFAILIIIFTLLYFIKHKKKAFSLVGSLFLTLLVLVGACFTPTKIYLTRLNLIPNTFNDKIEKVIESSDSKYEYKSEEWWHEVYDGNIHYDPGRENIWEMYISDWKSSSKTILFGRGISAKQIGKVMEHNTFIQLLWKHGIVGDLLLLVIFISFIKFRELKRHLLGMLLVLIPLFACAFVESFNYFVKCAIIILIMYQCLTHNEVKNNTNDVIEKYI